MSTDPTEPPRPVEIGAYDATGNLIARTTVGADGVLAEPLHVPAGGMVYAMGWPVAIPLGSGSTVTRTVPLGLEGGRAASEGAAVEPGEAERLLTALTDDCHGGCAHEGVGGECLCTSAFFPAIAALQGSRPATGQDVDPTRSEKPGGDLQMLPQDYTFGFDANVYDAIAWMNERGYAATFTGAPKCVLLYARGDEPARMARPGDVLHWDGRRMGRRP